MGKIFDKVVVFGAKFMKKNTNFMLASKKDFDKSLEKHKKIIVIFGHPLCKPCQEIMFRIPVIYLKLAKKGVGLKFCNVNEFREFEVKKVPTLVLFENKKEIKRVEETGIFDFIKSV